MLVSARRETSSVEYEIESLPRAHNLPTKHFATLHRWDLALSRPLTQTFLPGGSGKQKLQHLPVTSQKAHKQRLTKPADRSPKTPTLMTYKRTCLGVDRGLPGGAVGHVGHVGDRGAVLGGVLSGPARRDGDRLGHQRGGDASGQVCRFTS